MNKFLTFPGIQPIYLGDIEFMQNSVKDAIIRLLVGLTGQEKPKCLLKAATPTSMGAIVFDGEVLPLKYFAGAVAGAACYAVESSYSGDRTFKDGEMHQCYEERVVVVRDGRVGDEYATSQFPTLESLLVRGALQGTERSVTHQTDDIFSKIRYCKLGNAYMIDGELVAIEDTTLAIVFENLNINLPDFTRFFPVTLGASKVVPGKMEVQSKVAKLSIPMTSLSADDQGSFSFTIVDIK